MCVIRLLAGMMATVFLTAVMAVGQGSGTIDDPWDCGAMAGTVFAVLGEDGTLTISGTGEMARFGDHRAPPWSNEQIQNEHITRVVIEEGVTTIGDYAFSNCHNLTSVEIRGSMWFIGIVAFSHCSSLKTIVIPDGVTTIRALTFNHCHSLMSVEIPSSVITIAPHAFANCSGLTNITIPGSVKTIGQFAFAYCTSLETIAIPDGVTTIESAAFYGCSSLRSVTIPNSVTTIERFAFQYCHNLESITIPGNVTSIEYHAFNDCTNLNTVISLNPVPPSLDIRDFPSDLFSFRNIPGTACLYVPEENIGAYSADPGWGRFGCIGFIDENGDPIVVSILDRATSTRPAAPRVTVRNRTLTVRPTSPESIARVRLVDVRGRSVRSFTVRGSGSYSLAQIPAGRYFIDIREGSKRERTSAVIGGRR